MTNAPLHSDVRFWRDPALPGVEARRSSYTRQAFRTHTHETYSVGLVEIGSTRFTLDGQPHAAKAGQLVVIHPGAPHACNPDTGSGISYRMFYISPGWLQGASPDETPPHFPKPVLDDPELYSLWDEMYDALVGGTAAETRQALLMACLRELTVRHAAPPGSMPTGAHRPEKPAMARVREHLAASAGERVSLDDLAQVAGLSRHHFLRRFKAATGLPPHTYQLQQAVEQAKALLAGGVPISQTALDAGFSDQSHFSRLFRQFTGATPRQYSSADGQPLPGA